jgi:AraC family transcriptional regulator
MPPSGVSVPGVTVADTVLLWTGGGCDVEMICNGDRRRWRRSSGMVDMLPAGTTIERVQWDGDPIQCVWAGVAGVFSHVEGPAHGPSFGVADPHLADLIQRLEREAHDDAPLGGEYVEALTLTLRAYLRARYCNEPARDGGHALTGPMTPPQREGLRAYIDEHVDRNISLAELAQWTGYSVNHFARLFKQAFRRSPHQYVIERRIERAKALLLDHRCSVAEVAVSCGFATQAHLNTAFKQRLGVTPGEFRRG